MISINENCAIAAKDPMGRMVLLRSCYHDREYYPLTYWITVSYHCPKKGAMSFDIDIREIKNLEGEGECPVCRVGIWLDKNTLGDLMGAVTPINIRNSM